MCFMFLDILFCISVDGINFYLLKNIINEFDFKIRISFEDVNNNLFVDYIILRVKMY